MPESYTGTGTGPLTRRGPDVRLPRRSSPRTSASSTSRHSCSVSSPAWAVGSTIATGPFFHPRDQRVHARELLLCGVALRRLPRRRVHQVRRDVHTCPLRMRRPDQPEVDSPEANPSGGSAASR